jgi:multicomponent K+:H+ antiporter subunit F
MSDAVVQLLLTVAQILIGTAFLLCVWRAWRGPAAEDRVLALDTMYMNAMLLILTLGVRFSTKLYFEAALVIGVLGFVATAALAKFLLRGEVIE